MRKRNFVQSFRLLFLSIFVVLMFSDIASPQESNAKCATPNKTQDFDVGTLSAREIRPVFADTLIIRDEDSPEIPSKEDFRLNQCETYYYTPTSGEQLWLRLTLRNTSSQAKDIGILFNGSFIGRAVLFKSWPANGSPLASDGYTMPIEFQQDNIQQTVLPVTIAPGLSEDLFIGISDAMGSTFTPVLMQLPTAERASFFASMPSLFFIGFLLAMLLISVVLFRHVDIKYYQYYAIYLATMVVAAILWDGWLHFVSDTRVNTDTVFRLHQILLAAAAVSYTLFARVILLGDEHSPTLRIFHTLIAGFCVFGLLSAIDPWILSLPLEMLFFCSAYTMAVVSYKRYRAGLAEALPLTMALVIIAIGLTASQTLFEFPLALNGDHFLMDMARMRGSEWAFQLGVLGETIFMALTISMRARLIAEQRSLATLEAEVLREKSATMAQIYTRDIEESRNRIEALRSTLIHDPKRELLSPADQRFVEWAEEQVRMNIDDTSFGVRELANTLGTSEKTLGRKLKQAVGQTSVAFIRSQRLARARELILTRQFNSVAEVGYAVGLHSISHFTKLYRQAYGETPSAALKQAAAAEPGDGTGVSVK